jgi:hypothetical protein
MSARFEFQMTKAERDHLHGGAERAGMSAAAVCRFGIKWMLNRLDVLATGGAKKSGRDIAKFLDEMRADPRLAPLVNNLEATIAALDAEGDGNPSAAAMYDLVALAAAEPLPLPEKIRLLADLSEFEGKFTIRRLPANATVTGDAG